MSTNEIISQIDQEIARLTKAKELLQDAPAKRGTGSSPRNCDDSSRYQEESQEEKDECRSQGTHRRCHRSCDGRR